MEEYLAARENAARNAKVAELISRSGAPSHQLRQDVQGRCAGWNEAMGKTVTAILKDNHGGIVALLGDSGMGKTQIAVGCIKYICTSMRPALYVRATMMFAELRECYMPGATKSERSVFEKFAKPHLLVIDEVDMRAHSESENRILPTIIDMRYGENRPTILIANVGEDEFRRQVGEKIFDRLTQTGGTILCDWPSFRVAAQDGGERV